MGKHPFKIDAVSQNIKSYTATQILSYNPNTAVKAVGWTVSAVQGRLSSTKREMMQQSNFENKKQEASGSGPAFQCSAWVFLLRPQGPPTLQ